MICCCLVLGSPLANGSGKDETLIDKSPKEITQKTKEQIIESLLKDAPEEDASSLKKMFNKGTNVPPSKKEDHDGD